MKETNHPPVFDFGRFKLRPYVKEDEQSVVNMFREPTAHEAMRKEIMTIQQAKNLFAKTQGIYSSDKSKRWFWIWGIEVDGKNQGHFELKETDNTKENELELVYMLMPEVRRQGILTKILERFKREQVVWDKKVIATVNRHNTVSIQLLDLKWGIESREKIFEEDEDDFYWKFVLTS